MYEFFGAVRIMVRIARIRLALGCRLGLVAFVLFFFSGILCRSLVCVMEYNWVKMSYRI